MGRLELPLPDLGLGQGSVKESVMEMEARIRAQAPPDLRDTIRVKTFKKGEMSGIVIEYDDRAENCVYAAMEYPRGGGKQESVAPSNQHR